MRVAQRLLKSHLHTHVSFTYVRIGGHVSDDLSGGASERRKNCVATEVPACKIEMDRMNVKFIMQSVSW